MWRRAEAHAKIARINEQDARSQLRRAEEHRDLAKDAIDTFYRDIFEKGLLNAPGLAVQKKKLIVDALQFYQRMLLQEIKDASLIQSAAETAAKIGMLTSDVEEISAAIPYFEQSVELARRAVNAEPDNIRRKLLFLKNINLLGVTWSRMQNERETEKCFRESLVIWSELVESSPMDPGYRRNLTGTQVNLANLMFRQGELVEAKAGYLAAREQFQILDLQSDDKFVSQLDLARIEFNLSHVADTLEESIDWLEASYARRRKLLNQTPKHGLARRDFVMSSEALARRYSRVPEKKTLADQVIAEGILEARIAVASDANNLEFARLLSMCLQAAGVIAYTEDRLEDAEGFFQETEPLITMILEKDRERFRPDVLNWLEERAAIGLFQKQTPESSRQQQWVLELSNQVSLQP